MSGVRRILLGQAEEEVRALEGFGHGHVFGQGELRLVLVQIRASLVQDALGVEHADIGGIDAELGVELGAGDGRRSGPGHDHDEVFGLLAGDFQRVDEARAGNDGRAVLVVVEHRDVHFLLEHLFDVEALGGLDVLKVDAAEGGLKGLHHFDDLVGIGEGEVDVIGVHVRERLEEHALAFHDRLAREGADVAEPEDGGAVGNDGHEVAAPGVGIGEGRIVGDGEAGVGDAGGIGHRQVFLGEAGFDGKDFKLSRAGFLMVGEGLFLGEQRHDDLLWFGFK